MMEWCCTQDLIVPTDQPFNMFQSPNINSWPNWGMDGGGSDGFGWNTSNYTNTLPISTSDYYHPLDEKLHHKLLFTQGTTNNNRVPDCSSQNSNVSSTTSGYSCRGGGDDFNECDDIFMNSLFTEDHPSSTEHDYDSSFCTSLMPLDSTSFNMQLSSSGETINTGGQVHLPITLNNTMAQQQQYDHHFPSPKALAPNPTNQISLSGGGNDTLLEDEVLHELVMVLSQLPERTRLCFRDSFYRLANKSGQEMPPKRNKRNQGLMLNENKTSHENSNFKDEVSKSEKNNIDVAVANLMFNKVELNTQDLVPAISVRSNNHHEQLVEGSGYNSFIPHETFDHHDVFFNDHPLGFYL